MVEATNNEEIRTFRAVVEAHQRDVYRLAFRLTNNHHDAEDLSQDVFIKVHKALPSFRGDSGLATWIHRITVNTYLNRNRKKALTLMRLKPEFEMEARGDTSDSRIEAATIRRQVTKAMEKLSPKEKSAFALRFDCEYSIKEIAQTLELADGTVKSLLFRAVKKMREQLTFLVEE